MCAQCEIYVLVIFMFFIRLHLEFTYNSATKLFNALHTLMWYDLGLREKATACVPLCSCLHDRRSPSVTVLQVTAYRFQKHSPRNLLMALV